MRNLPDKLPSIFALLFVFATFSFAQTGRGEAIALFKQGKNKEAVAALEKVSKENKTDAEIWNYLGLAYVKNDDLKKGIRAFEKAAALNPQNETFQTNVAYTYLLAGKLNKAQTESTKALKINSQSALAYYIRGAANIREGDVDEAATDADKAIAADANYAAAYILKSDALLGKFGSRIESGAKLADAVNLLQEAKTTLEACLKNCRNNLQAGIQQDRLETLKIFYDYFDKNKDAILRWVSEKSSNQTAATIPPPPPVDPSITPLKILTKPRPEYTDRARQNGTQGIIRMVVLFAANGQITQTLILKGIGSGLDENALKAVRKIKFEPARKDGKPISQVKIIEYSFAIY